MIEKVLIQFLDWSFNMDPGKVTDKKCLLLEALIWWPTVFIHGEAKLHFLRLKRKCQSNASKMAGEFKELISLHSINTVYQIMAFECEGIRGVSSFIRLIILTVKQNGETDRNIQSGTLKGTIRRFAHAFPSLSQFCMTDKIIRNETGESSFTPIVNRIFTLNNLITNWVTYKLLIEREIKQFLSNEVFLGDWQFENL